MIIRNKFNGYVNGNNRLYPGGGGGQPTQNQTYNTNIPEYAEPYVTTMLGATEKQVYNYGPEGNITGFQPYKAYTDYDRARGGTGETVAGFTPMQVSGMQGFQNYQLPRQTGTASRMAGMAGLGSMGAGQRYEQQATNPYATQAYMSPYMEGALAPQLREAQRQSVIQGQQNQAQAVQQGAFGGSRSAIVEAERQRNLGQQQADIYGKGMQDAFQNAQQSQQFGAKLGLEGYGQGAQAAGQLGSLGQQQYGQELGLMGKRMEVGGQQQAYEQNRLNQIIQDYATSQQYPLMQLGVLSNMLRGLPMQAATTQMYQAQPSGFSQGAGALGTGMTLYNQAKTAGFNVAEGGYISDEGVKKYAKGGITGEFAVSDIVSRLSDAQLDAQLKNPNSPPEVKEAAAKETQRRAELRGMAGGGVVAFADEGLVEDQAAAQKRLEAADKAFDEAQARKKASQSANTDNAPPNKTEPLGIKQDYNLEGATDTNKATAQAPAPAASADIVDTDVRRAAALDAYRKMTAPNEGVTEGVASADTTEDIKKSVRDAITKQPVSRADQSSGQVAKPTAPVQKDNTVIDAINKGILGTIQARPVSSADGKTMPPPDVAGIKTDAPKAAPAPAPVAKGPVDPDAELADYAQTQKLIKDRSVYEQAALTREERKKLGIVSPYAGELEKTDEKRRKIEAGAKDEYMDRLSEFLMTWGSLPGPTLVAANQAGRQFIANSISDKKERKRLLDGLDASASAIKQAQYLENLGDHKDAEVKIKDAGKIFFEVNEKLREGKVKAAEFKNAMDRTMATLSSEEARATAKLQMDKALKHMEVNKATDFMNQVAMRVEGMVANGALRNADTVNKAMIEILELTKGTDAKMISALASLTGAAAATTQATVAQTNAITNQQKAGTDLAEAKGKLAEQERKEINSATLFNPSKENAAKLRKAREQDANANIDVANPKSAELKVLNDITNSIKNKPAYKPLRDAEAPPASAEPKKDATPKSEAAPKNETKPALRWNSKTNQFE